MSPALLPIAQGQIELRLAWGLHYKGTGEQEALDRLVRALDLLPMNQHDLRGAASAQYAIALQCLGRTEEALAWINAERNGGTALHPDYDARLVAAELCVELASGRLIAAADTGRRMVAHGNRLQHPLMIGWGHLTLGRVAYEWNDLAGARDHFERILVVVQDVQGHCALYATLGLALTHIARGERGVAERLVLAKLEQAEEARNSFFAEDVRSFMARLALAVDDPDRAASWLAQGTYTRQGVTGFDIEDQLLTRARVLVARATSETLDEASAAVDRAIEAAEARHVTASLVQGLAVRALVERKRGDMAHAAESIARALEVARPGQFTRTFIDLGPPLTELLTELASHGDLPKGGPQVLMACRAESVVRASDLRDQAALNLAKALTWRELDVLQLLDGHFTHNEIAELLSLDPGLVKRYAANISRKLQVTGQEDAVLRAYDLGILRAEDRETPLPD